MNSSSLSQRSRNAWNHLWRFTVAVVTASPGKVVASVLVMLGLSVAEGVGVLLLIPLLALVGVDVESGPIEGVVVAFGKAFSAVGVRPTVGIVLAVYVGVVALQSAMQRLQAHLGSAVQEEFVTHLRARVYRAIVDAEWVFLARSRASDYTHALVTEMSRVSAAAKQLIELAVMSILSVVYLALAFRLLPVMAALVVTCGAALAWAIRGKIYDARASARQVSMGRKKLQAAMIDHLGSMKTAKSYGLTHHHAETFRRLSDELRVFNLKAVADTTILQQRLYLGQTVLLAGIVYVSYGILAVPTAQLLVLLFLFARLLPRLTQMVRQAQALAAALPAFDEVIDIERNCLAAAERPSGDRLEVEFRGSIRLERVTFRYPRGAASPAIAEVDLEIPAATTTAIVGPSGAGKSTLVDLLIGLLPPEEGRVLLDGRPLDSARLAAWRRQLGYVSQDTFMFHDTIAANLRWARPEATDADLWEALQLAAAEDFVKSLPKRLDTVVGDRGVLISGGERQRLSLARALVRRPRVLVLDEATSSLDSENEMRIRQAISGLHRHMTIIIVTHRLSTVRDADIIHVLDHGRLVEAGTWNELMARPAGRFRELCQAQGIEVSAPVGHATLDGRVQIATP